MEDYQFEKLINAINKSTPFYGVSELDFITGMVIHGLLTKGVHPNDVARHAVDIMNYMKREGLIVV